MRTVALLFAVAAILAFVTACSGLPHRVGIFAIQSTEPLVQVRGLVQTPHDSMYFVGTQDVLDRIYETAPRDALSPISADPGWPNIYGIAPTRNGSVWFTARDSARKSYIVLLTNGRRMLMRTHGSAFRVTAAPDSSAWFTEPSSDEIGHITAGGRLTEYKIPHNEGHAGPWDIVYGNDGNVWFTLTWADAIGRITRTGRITEFHVPTRHSRPFGIAAGSDGTVWFTELTSNKIGRITPTGRVQEFADPALRDSPSEIVTGKDGEMWFCEMSSIGRILRNGAISVKRAPLGTCSSVAEDEQRNVWFTQNIPAAYPSNRARTAITSFNVRQW